MGCVIQKKIKDDDDDDRYVRRRTYSEVEEEKLTLFLRSRACIDDPPLEPNMLTKQQKDEFSRLCDRVVNSTIRNFYLNKFIGFV